MLVLPARRRTLIAVARRIVMTRGAWPVRTAERSSSSTTSARFLPAMVRVRRTRRPSPRIGDLLEQLQQTRTSKDTGRGASAETEACADGLRCWVRVDACSRDAQTLRTRQSRRLPRELEDRDLPRHPRTGTTTLLTPDRRITRCTTSMDLTGIDAAAMVLWKRPRLGAWRSPRGRP